MTTSFVIDYSMAVNGRAKIQRAADAAALVAASTYRDSDDKAASIKRAGTYFDNAVGRIDGAKFNRSFTVDKSEKDGEIVAATTVDITFDSLFRGGGIMKDVMRSEVEAVARIKHVPQDLYLVLLVDATGSMWTLINSVKEAVRNLEEGVRLKLNEKGLEFNRFYVKVAFFRDLRFDESPGGWRESPLFDLSKPADIDAFRHFVAATPASGGYDLPESGPAAIAHFLTAPLPEPLKSATTVQSIVLWTDAAGLALDDKSSVDDVTVNLYKRLGNISADPDWKWSFPTGWYAKKLKQSYYDEDTEYDGDAIGNETSPPSYGCCSTSDVFANRWLTGGAVPLKQRTLGLIAPIILPPWDDMMNWKNVSTRNYVTPSATGIIDDVVDSLNGSYSPLAVSR